MRLSDDERAHLFHLAGHRPPPADGVARLARAGLVRLLDLLGDTPARVVSDRGEVLAQNRASVLLTGDHTGFTGDRRYLAYRWFTDPAARAVGAPEERENRARQLVADLRATAGRRAGDPVVAGLVDRLHTASAGFGRLWAEHEVAVRRADRKTFLHPRVGRLVMDCETAWSAFRNFPKCPISGSLEACYCIWPWPPPCRCPLPSPPGPTCSTSAFK